MPRIEINFLNKKKNRRMNFQQSDLFKILDDMKQRKFLRS